MSNKQKKFDWMTPLIFLGIILGLLHYWLTGVFVGAIDSSCKIESERFADKVCECRKSKYRSSMFLEHFFLGQLNSSESKQKARTIMYDTMNICPNWNY